MFYWESVGGRAGRKNYVRWEREHKKTDGPRDSVLGEEQDLARGVYKQALKDEDWSFLTRYTIWNELLDIKPKDLCRRAYRALPSDQAQGLRDHLDQEGLDWLTG